MIRIKINGPPGTGKTYTLINYLIMYKFLTQSNFIMETYSKKLATDIKNRLSKILVKEYGYDEEKVKNELKFVGTTHAICKRLLGINRVVQAKHKREFCKKIGYISQATDGEEKDDNEDVLIEKEKGDVLFNIIQWCIETMNPIQKWGDCPIVPSDIDITTEEIIEFDKDWKKFKNDYEGGRIYDFNDMLSLALDHKDIIKEKIRDFGIKIYFADEFQDKTPLQYEIFKSWSDEDMEIVGVAGDPNQTIHTYKGCDSRFFKELNYNENFFDYNDETLDESFRCPINFYELSRDVYPDRSQTIDLKCQPPGILEEIGRMDEFYNKIYKPLKEDETRCVLARTNWHVRIISNKLKERGIPFIGKYGLQLATKNNIYFIERILEDKNEISIYDIRILLKKFKRDAFIGKKVNLKKKVDKLIEKIKGYEKKIPLNIVLSQSFLNALRENKFSQYASSNYRESYEYVEKIINAKREGYIHSPDSFYIGTIHSGKGGEWMVEFLLTSITPKVYETDDIETERNVWHTGITRSKKILYIVNDDIGKYRYYLPDIEKYKKKAE